MKEIPAGLRAHLDSGATTLCWCWRVSKRDGVRLGFTDHDRDVAFDGTVFEAAAGFEASEIRDQIGLGVDNLEVTSALSSERLSEADLAAGLYDDAGVEIWRVNWQDTSQRVLMRSGSLGEVKRSGATFVAEVRGLAHYLQQPKGRLFQYTCDADVGDARCKVAIDGAAYRGAAAVQSVDGDRRLRVSGLASFPAGFFARGLMTITSGAAAGQQVEVRGHAVEPGAAILELWEPLRIGIGAGDQIVVTAGCDKHIATCRDKFQNAINFRGFPSMPGNDLLTRVVRTGR